MEFKYLVMVNPGANNNKFYRMIPNGGNFKVEYGRVGNTSFQSRSYPSYDFYKKYQEKVDKGYSDQTNLYQETVVVKPAGPSYEAIPDVDIQRFIDDIMSFANIAIKENYTIASEQVTRAMVDAAQELIDRMRTLGSVPRFNEYLVQLFTTIPRRMHHVADHLASTLKDLDKILEDEQDLLDVMRTKVYVHTLEEADASEEKINQTILEAMGLEVKKITEKEEAHLKKYLGRSLQDQFIRAFRVENKKTRKRFNEYRKTVGGKEKKVEEFWHGSRNENWWNIINTGLMLRPNAVITGKMFGYGLYFANRAAKSLGYTSTSGSRWASGSSRKGYLAVFDVLYGDPYLFDKNWQSEFSSLNYEKLQKLSPGADSFHAKSGNGTSLMNDEIIVYKEEQATIKYIVEISA